MNGICYIVGAGDFYGRLEPGAEDLVIAADGGYDTLCRLGLRCDLLIGDMDSIAISDEKTERLLYPVEKDDTDTALAYLEGVRRGYTEFKLFGCVGGREDHTFACYSLIADAIRRGHRLTLIGNGYETYALKDEKTYKKRDTGRTISIFAFGNEARGVTLRGLKYPLDSYTLSPFIPLGVSNSFTDLTAEIEVKDGVLLVMEQVGEPEARSAAKD